MNPTAAVLVIGNEILSGRTKDANLGHIAEALSGIGVRLREARVVADVEEEIVAAVNALRARYTYVFTTGGIGPTHDDITSACVAKAFGVALERNPEAVARLERHYGSAQHLNEARLRMANIPAGGILIDNPISQAPGFQLGNVFVLAGVPNIMQAMLDGLLPRLAGGPELHARTVACELAEGVIAAELGALQDRHPELEIGSYPYFRNGFFGVSLVLRGTDEAEVAATADELAGIVRRLGGTPNVTVGTKG
ncbi:molybdenum cofactor synthesis domain-containing protein [Azospirillum agricola]|uniref:competence/damage-inducible protein A n=1 Tax=Azospirillum agricola TaxID=1720247 RepID=UPI001AE2513D|nr:molybdopterin-binding protein [Azospirillum agricola]MBP2227996.1 molybdenum cofactor synthesis domain-containing protein [Azospirillum agricola]